MKIEIHANKLNDFYYITNIELFYAPVFGRPLKLIPFLTEILRNKYYSVFFTYMTVADDYDEPMRFFC